MHILKKTFFAISVLLLCIGCNNTVNVTISGKLEVAAESEVWIGVMDLDKTIPIDSMKTNSNGEFTIELSVDQPSLYYLTVGERPIYLVVTPKDDIFVNIDNSLENAPYYIEGSID